MSVEGPSHPLEPAPAFFHQGDVQANAPIPAKAGASEHASIAPAKPAESPPPTAVVQAKSALDSCQPSNCQKFDERSPGSSNPSKDAHSVVPAQSEQVVSKDPDTTAKTPDEKQCSEKQHQNSKTLDQYASHLRVCNWCCDHEIGAHEGEIAKLRAIKKSRKVIDADDGDDNDNEIIEAESKRELKVTKIPTGLYREVKTGINTTSETNLDEASVLLMTTDGANYGVRRIINPVETAEERRRPSSVNHEAVGLTKQSSVEVPFRLVLNSGYLNRILSKVTGVEITKTTNVFVRPFKYLIYHEAQVKEALAAFDVACEKLVAERLPEQKPASAALGNITSVVSNTASEQGQAQERVSGVRVTTRARDLLRCLVDFMDFEMSDLFATKRQIAGRTLEEITFDYLWLLYTPGDIIIADPGAPSKSRRAYRVLYITGGRPNLDRKRQRATESRGVNFNKLGPTDIIGPGSLGNASKTTPVVIDCFYIDFDGDNYGPRPARFILPEFTGSRKISSLAAYPIDFDPEKKSLTKALQDRGQDFADCAHGAHKQYTGRTVPELALNTLKTKRNVIFDLDCECVIDQKAALDRAVLPSGKEMAHDGFSAENKLGFGSGVISTPSEANGDETFDVAKCNAPGCTQCTDMFDDSSFDLDARTKYVHEEALLERVTEPGEQHLLLLPTRLYGYALHHREWYALNVNTLSEIRSRKQQKDASSAFDDLVLPEKHKKTIRALVKHQTRSFGESSSASHDGTKPAGVPMQGLDLIRGKGRGLIILLHGAPGVGKTSTAESVAIQLKRPLLPITCGDLGTRAEVVEQRLEDFFNLAARWGCVVLLDEADVFLAKRVTGDLERNGLVSVFLRQLEYYSGVLILTTNRVGEFDEAFVSRIHMKLHYPRLDKESTMEIWEMNIRRIRENMDLGIDVKEDGIREFARKYWKSNASTTGRQWNGRQIKNAFQTAVALAYWEWWEEGRKRDKPVLKKSQFKDVCETSIDFDQHIDKLYGARSKGAFAEEAERYNLRYDSDHAEDEEKAPRAVNGARSRYAAASRAPRAASARDDGRDEEIKELKRQLAMKSGGKVAPANSKRAAAAGPVSDDDNLSKSEASSDSESDDE